MSQVVATGATVRASNLSREPERLLGQRVRCRLLPTPRCGPVRSDLSGEKREVRIRASSQADWAWTRSSPGRLPLPGHSPD